jgi:iron complex outermembrane receptor protein
MGTTVLSQATGTVTGVVSDSITRENLLGVNVIVGDQMTNTDYIDGKYTIDLPEGEQVLEFRYLGYLSTKKKVMVVAGETKVLNVDLKEEATMLGTATVSSSKFEKSLGEATVSIEVIQPSLIENTNAQAVNEVLDKVPGVNTMGDQVTIRGGAGFAQGTGSRVLVLMDDMPALQADAGLPNWADLPTENIAQMEVLKGAASALYGSAALNGVINIRTAYPLKEPLTKVSLFGTVYGDPKNSANKWWTGKNMPFSTGLQFAHRRKAGKFDIVLGSNLTYNRSFMRGYKELPDGTIDSMPAYHNRARLTGNFRYRHSEKLIFGLNTNLNLGAQSTYLFHARINPNLGLYESDFDPAPRGQNLRLSIDPSMTLYDNHDGRHRVQLRYFYIDNNNEGNQSNSSNMVYGEYQFQRKFEQLMGLELAAGIVGSHITSDSDVYSGDKYAHNNMGVYLQLDQKFFKKLNISLGFRYELNSTQYPDSLAYQVFFDGVLFDSKELALNNITEGRPVFRAGLNYELTEGTFLRGSFGQGYRFPTVLEKFISTSAGGIAVIPNPDLRSETGWSAEFGVKQGFRLGKWKGFIDLAAFWSEYDDMMEFQAAPGYFGIAFQVQNIGSTIINGFDLGIMGQGNIGMVSIDLIAGYTLLNPQYKNFGDSATRAEIVSLSTSEENILKYRNRHTIKLDAQGTFKGFSLGFTFLYLSQMEAIDKFLERGDLGTFNQNAETKILDFRRENPNGSLIMNARVAYQLTKFAKVSLLVNNFINNEYSLQPGMLAAPINFVMRADFKF